MTSRALLVGLLLNSLSCSLLVDNGADQCASDIDCTRFSGTTCDLGVHLCKPFSLLSDTTPNDAGGVDGSSADACAAIATFENACTNSACKPFSNRMRLTRLPPDGGLTPLPVRDAGKYDAGNGDAAIIDAARNDAAKDDDRDAVGFEDASKNQTSADDAGKDGD